jgi:hypothetical protein
MEGPVALKLIDWLRKASAAHEWEPVAVFRRRGTHKWPLTATNEQDLARQLDLGGHFIALPKEPAALANIIEVSIVDFLIEQLKAVPGAEYQRGTERGYPDLEVCGSAFGGGFHAVDVKVAQLNRSGNQTQSRITLYTGNTFFRYPTLHWPGTFRPFAEYASTLVVLGLYRLNRESHSRVENLRLVVQETWRIASKQRSSTTREYLGAVQKVSDLDAGRGEFESEKQFYDFWRRYNFRIGTAVARQLERLLADKKKGS